MRFRTRIFSDVFRAAVPAAIAMLLVWPTAAAAAVDCKARVLLPVRAVGDVAGKEPGEIMYRVTQYIRQRHTGRTYFCAQGDYCYWTHVMVGGRQREAVRLINCVVAPELIHTDDEGDRYGLELDRRSNSAAVLRLNDLENALVEIGLDQHSASQAARQYLRRPRGRCAVLVRQALEGNPGARRRLAGAYPTANFRFPTLCIGR